MKPDEAKSYIGKVILTRMGWFCPLVEMHIRDTTVDGKYIKFNRGDGFPNEWVESKKIKNLAATKSR